MNDSGTRSRGIKTCAAACDESPIEATLDRELNTEHPKAVDAKVEDAIKDLRDTSRSLTTVYDI